jgi:hypothetical protein
MDYREELFRPLSIRFVDKLVSEILLHPQDFQHVYRLIFDPELKVAWRAAWACQKMVISFFEVLLIFLRFLTAYQ